MAEVETKAEVEAPKPKTKAKKQTTDQLATIWEQRFEAQEARLAEVERKQKVLVDGYEFAANEMRPLYGFGAVALVFDAIHKKLAE
jgi:hypothetical protein